MYAPPETQDDMCFWRCLAGFFKIKDARRLEKAANDLAKRCLEKRNRSKKVSMETISEVAQKVDITITVYNPFGTGDQIMNIGIVEGHCYLIKDLEGLCKIWRCTKCGVAFNRASNLKRDKAEVDFSPEPKVVCEEKRVEGILSTSDKVFYGTRSGISLEAAQWIASQEGPHIHHAYCGHGGDRTVEVRGKKIRVDGYEPTTGTVYQYHGCYWHECPCIEREGPGRGSRESTLAIDAAIAEKHPMVVVWEHEVPNPPKIQFDHQFHPYPGFIVYDFEARMKKLGEQKTEFYEVCAEHVPISVAISDNVTNEPVYLVDSDQKSVVARFSEVLLEKRKAILAKVTKMFQRPCDFDRLSNEKKWENWEQQVPVFGFNSSSYDLRLIMRYFAEDLCNLGGVKMAEKDGSYFFILTQQFKFLDVCKFLAPGTSYAKWIGSHGWKDAKLVFPYEWLDDFGKLSQGPPPIEAFTTRMKGPLDEQSYDGFLTKYQEEGCENMGDWLKVYNLADVVPFVDCVKKEIEKYVPFGIDICKDAVSITGVSLRYLINQSEKALYAPTEPVYELLKKGMIGGPSIVFCRYAETGVTKIKNHLFEDARVCKSVVGYDANLLYPYTFSRQMPCGKAQYRSKCQIPTNVRRMILNDEIFGFFLVDIRVPDDLKETFSEFPPIFIITQVPDEQIAPAMRAYRDRPGRAKGARKLVSVLEAKKVVLYSPLIKWYLQKGLIIDQFYEAAIYNPGQPFSWFPEMVAQERREADENPNLSQVGETYKLLANSAYGKMIENLERQDPVELTADVRRVQKLVLDPFFRDAEEVGGGGGGRSS